MAMKLLFLDIEVTPALSWHYGLWNQNIGISQIERPPEIIGWASRWYGEGPSTCEWYGAEDMASFEVLWRQLDEATHVGHFNGKTFDMPWINHEFFKKGVFDRKPPSPYKQIDLMKQIRRNFRSISNKLAFLSTDLFGLEGKIDESALALWIEMWRAKEAEDWPRYERALYRMAKYCKRDVNLLPKMYDMALPWLTGINQNVYNDERPDSCTNCKGTKFHRRGYAYTAQSKFPEFRCAKCGKTVRGTKAVGRAEYVEVR